MQGDPLNGQKNEKLGYTLNGHGVIPVTEEKDLRVQMIYDLKWMSYITGAVKRLTGWWV